MTPTEAVGADIQAAQRVAREEGYAMDSATIMRIAGMIQRERLIRAIQRVADDMDKLTRIDVA